MAIHISDRFLWVAAGLAAYLTSRAIASVLKAHVQIPESDRRKPAPTLSQEKEDKIPLKALETLTTHPNTSIRDAALTILCDRYLKDTVLRNTLLASAVSPHIPLRQKAAASIDLIRAYTNVDLTEELRLTHPPRHADSSITIDPLVATAEDAERRNAAVEILSARRQRNTAAGTGIGEGGRTRRPLRREENSPQEEQARRRRREAMVLHEGSAPVTRDDIIQRPREGSVRNEEEVRRMERALRDLTGGGG
ncbi:hypothetical protein K402DRAFT_416589 [Aulographum hederae CBS 113979]|uniref:Uncharacterized protein n=1 Tax=Aulographum hederae CBS 113979 TaxID=1176131 RepID=A0A6G1HFV2_9PEZI|nr:hypothetical protein K402DRAFT_416589 [Aulographum hederae CBS 113979]